MGLLIVFAGSAITPTVATASVPSESRAAVAVRDLAYLDTLGLYSEPLGEMPAYYLAVGRPPGSLHTHGHPLVEEEDSEEIEVFCKGGTRFRFTSFVYSAANRNQTVTVSLVAGGPESISSMTVVPAASWRITENLCNITYTIGGTSSCTALKVELTATANGVYTGEIQITYGGGAHGSYDMLTGHIP